MPPVDNKKEAMSAFINPEDYDASIHAEILDSLLRANKTTLETCEDRAVETVRGYLAARYDTEAIFAAEGEARHPLILMVCLDIAIYHVFCQHNPQKMSEVRLKRYDDALEWLKRVQKGEVTIYGAPTLDEETMARNGYYLMRSDTKRENRV